MRAHNPSTTLNDEISFMHVNVFSFTFGSRKRPERYDGTVKVPPNSEPGAMPDGEVDLASSCLMVNMKGTRSPPGNCGARTRNLQTGSESKKKGK
jgi:hypothetical protein